MHHVKKILKTALTILTLLIVFVSLAVAIGAWRSGRQDEYFSLLLGQWDLVLVAVVLGTIGSEIYDWIVKKYNLR